MFLKSISFLTFSGISITGLVSPVSYLSYTGTFFKKMWKRDLSLKTPVLKCKNGGQKNLGFYLNLGDSGGGIDQSDNSILLKIAGGENGGRAINRERTHFHLEYKTEGVGQVIVMTNKQAGSSPSYGRLECSDSMISLKGSAESGEEIWKHDSEIYGMFTEQNKENCKRGIGRIECDIELKENSNLKWNTNEKPKVIYTAF